jgi:small nuclear ribonucleoprotein (snRNP)-like protein
MTQWKFVDQFFNFYFQFSLKKKERRPVGRILLKGENVALISAIPDEGNAV